MSAIIIGVLSVMANIVITIWSIKTNRQIEVENAGKNRIIYAMEEVNIDKSRGNPFAELNTKLNSGNYTVMNILQDLSNTSKRIYTLAKIRI
jgi:hypothetical protein